MRFFRTPKLFLGVVHSFPDNTYSQKLTEEKLKNSYY